MVKLIRLLSLFLLFLFIQKTSLTQGLQFYSNNKLIAERTSYHVFDQKTVSFKDYISLSFQLSIIDPGSFGYILYVEDVENNLYYNLTYTNENDSLSYLKLSFQSKAALINIPIAKNLLGHRKWHDIKITFHAINDSIAVSFNNEHFKVKTNIISSKVQPEIYFGKHESFIDVPEIAIRRLVVAGENKSHSFQFNEINGNIVHNENGENIGFVENPFWLIKESYYWEFLQQFEFNGVTAVNFDKKNQRFVLANGDSLFFYLPVKDQVKKYKFNNKLPVPLRLGTSFIDAENQYLFVYEVNDVNETNTTMARIDLTTLEVNSCCFDELEEQRHHHVSYLDKINNKYWIFGGFGNKHYSNEFFAFDLDTYQWDKTDFTGDIIPPRFFSGGTEISDQELLIFGGAGNPSGDQTVGKIYYTDCFRVNLDKKNITKLWELSKFDERRVSSRNMLISPDSAHFYTLYYKEYNPNTSLNLYRFSIKDGSFTILGDSIPMISERIRTNANLYLNLETNEIYCVTQEFKLNGSSKVKIYSLSNPPVSKNEFFSNSATEKTNTKLLLIIALALLLVTIVLISAIKIVQRKKAAINQQRKLIQAEINTSKKYTRPVKNAVYLFGNFQSFDRKGHDNSHLFSPKIKQLFLLILLRNNKGKTTSADIYEAIWPNKPTDKAKNSKGVTLNQLRKILLDLDGIELKSDNKYLFFDVKKGFYCDYFKFVELLTEISDDNQNNELMLKELIPIVSQGRFLACIENEYFDSYKGAFEAEVFKIMPYHLEKSFKDQNYIQVIQIAKIIFNIDYTNELAFHYQLLSYVRLGMMEKAKKRYNAFIIDFKKENNDGYPYTFRELVKFKALELIREKPAY